MRRVLYWMVWQWVAVGIAVLALTLMAYWGTPPTVPAGGPVPVPAPAPLPSPVPPGVAR